MKKDRETLVILIPGFPKDEADSTCLPAQQTFVRVLKERYPTLHVIVLSFQYPYHTNPYSLFGAEIFPFSLKTQNRFQKLLTRQKIWKTLKGINEKNKVIGLLSFWCSECAWVGKRFANQHGLKHYCWIMGQDAKKENKYPGRIKPSPTELIALSDFLQDEFERNHGVRPGYVIPLGVDVTNNHTHYLDKSIDVVAVGSLIPLKQYDIFLEVLAELKKQNPSIKGVLIGQGPERDKLVELINKLDLESNITVTGELPHPEVLKYMRKSRLFLHTSSYEGFGMVCLEALAEGCNVISFHKSMKQDIDHWLIAENAGDMIREASELLSNPNSLASPKAVFNAGDTVRKIIKLFSS